MDEDQIPPHDANVYKGEIDTNDIITLRKKPTRRIDNLLLFTEVG